MSFIINIYLFNIKLKILLTRHENPLLKGMARCPISLKKLIYEPF